VIKKVYQLAYEAQLLSGNLEATIDSTGSARGAMRHKIRGIELKKRPLPIIQFDIGQITIDEQGQRSAQQLATYLKRQKVAQVTLIGHTDSKGNHAINEKISKQRALTVKNYLQQLGVAAHIITLGKGETEPLPLANLAFYTPDEIDALNRRVEFLMQ
jgi:outer membrane protein OmpA-like peptidoglycan-associated protein